MEVRKKKILNFRYLASAKVALSEKMFNETQQAIKEFEKNEGKGFIFKNDILSQDFLLISMHN